MRAPKILSREDIQRAQKVTLSNRAAARYLHVSLPTYGKYAKLYKEENGKSMWDNHRNQGGKGIPKYAASWDKDYNTYVVPRDPKKKRKKREPPIVDIMEGRVSAAHFNPQQLKYKLITLGFLEPKCGCCGYDAKRAMDGKSPLILRHINGDKNDWHLENLRFECYNCAFLNGYDSVITDDMVEKAEDGLDRFGNKLESTYELDEYQEEYLRELFHEKEEKPGEEYISRF